MVLRARRRASSPLQPDGGLLGVFPDETYDTATARLAPGDRLLVYTDGIELAFGGEAIDAERWQSELRARAALSSASTSCSTSASTSTRQSGSLTPKDDVTAVLVDVIDV